MIERLLGDLPLIDFIDRHYGRIPYSRPAGAAGFTTFGGRAAVDAVLAAKDVDAFAARDGAMWEGGRTPSPEEARRLEAEGWTIIVRNAERHDPELARLAGGLGADLAAPVNVHVYATPAGRTGFGWHYDPEDVFIVQVEGSKEYRLRKNTVNPWPLLAQMPKDLRYEREITPEFAVTVAPGDWLYVPTGWWHAARGVETGVTLAIGLMTRSAFDLPESLKGELLTSLPWRQRFTSAGRTPEEAAKAMEPALAELGKDLARKMAEALRRVAASTASPAR